jgi:hypothetical protein
MFNTSNKLDAATLIADFELLAKASLNSVELNETVDVSDDVDVQDLVRLMLAQFVVELRDGKDGQLEKFLESYASYRAQRIINS